MKITSFYPMITTQHVDDLLKVYEDLGFEIAHKFDPHTVVDSTQYILKDENGNRLCITNAKYLPRDMMAIHCNVDNFLEAKEYLLSKGYIIANNNIIRTDSSVYATFVAPTGSLILIMEHLKKK